MLQSKTKEGKQLVFHAFGERGRMEQQNVERENHRKITCDDVFCLFRKGGNVKGVLF